MSSVFQIRNRIDINEQDGTTVLYESYTRKYVITSPCEKYYLLLIKLKQMVVQMIVI